MDDEVPSRSLTIYLSKENVRRNALVRGTDGVTEKQIPVGRAIDARLLIKPPDAKPPIWADLFKDYVQPREFGNASSPGAVLLVPILQRWAAITFGQGRHLLSTDAFEDRFGLRVALNCIDEEKIRSLDKQTFDAIARHTVEQASHEANAGEFGFDIERDMLRAVTGTPRNDDYGKRLTGMDALNTQIRVRLRDLYDLLKAYHDKFFDDSYRRSFPWVDQIALVSDPTVERDLNDSLIKMIREQRFDETDERCWLAIPDVIDWARVSGFRYSQAPRRPELYDIHLKSFLEHLQHPENLSILGLKGRKVFCMGDNDQIMKSWSVFNCLYCELDRGGQSYVLNAGKWYALENDFVKQVNASFEKIPIYSGTFAEYNDETESDYNARVVRDDSNRYFLMDRNLTYRGGQMEFCDIFSKDKELIHVKRYGGSATLSHLFYQGVTSAEFFQMDTEYRRLIRNKLSRSFQLFDPRKRPDRDEYHVIFGIISRSDKPLTMPFFSRVGIRHAMRRLQGFGYKVSLAKIGVAETRSKLQKMRPRLTS